MPAASASACPTTPQRLVDCAASLGARRDFYGTAETRATSTRFGGARIDKVAVAAVSYGTELAVEYAREYPAHVERLLLDSVALLDQPDPFATGILSRLPATLRRYCAGGECKTATPSLAADVAALARNLETQPLAGSVLPKDGGRRPVRLTKSGFLSLVIDSDLSPGLALELPAAVHAARYGNAAPILRFADLDYVTGATQRREQRPLPGDGLPRPPLPVAGPTASPAQRRSELAAAIRALPARELGGFGRWAAEFGNASSCARWPDPSGGQRALDGPVPGRAGARAQRRLRPAHADR